MHLLFLWTSVSVWASKLYHSLLYIKTVKTQHGNSQFSNTICIFVCHLLTVQVVPVVQWDQVGRPYPRYKDKHVLLVNWTSFVYEKHHVATTCTSSPLVPGVPWFPGRPLSPFSPGSPGGPIRPINPPWPCRQRHGSSALFPRVLN